MPIKITSPTIPNPTFLSSGGAGSILTLNLPESFALSTPRVSSAFFTEVSSGTTPATSLPAPPPDFLAPPPLTPPDNPNDPDLPPVDPPADPLQFCVELLGGTFCPTLVSYCENGQEKFIYVLAAGS